MLKSKQQNNECLRDIKKRANKRVFFDVSMISQQVLLGTFHHKFDQPIA